MLACCVVTAAVKAVSLWLTKSRLLQEEVPFTVYVTAKNADEAEYVVRSAMERIRWLDLSGVPHRSLNPAGDPEIEEIYKKLIRKYPFTEIGALQTRKRCSIIKVSIRKRKIASAERKSSCSKWRAA